MKVFIIFLPYRHLTAHREQNRPPNSNSDYFNLILESTDRAHNTNIHDIIITGDFNYNMLSNNNNKIKDLLLQFNLTQLIKDATHFTETSASLIDLIIKWA